ncbi:MAG: allophanate hydrolase [Microvirga sp.]
MSDAHLLTLADYRRAFREGWSTPSRQVEETGRRIAAHDDPAMFIALRNIDDLMAEARALESRDPASLPLYGIPVAVKDNIDVAGLPTTAACPDFARTPEADATAVARLRAAGALIVGKTNLDQFATGLAGVRSPYGVPRNTFRSDLVPGGSSSGSATAVAAGIVPLALGTDTAGSGRVPAALNNIVGLKPSLGAVSTIGVFPACRSLDCVSVFALTVEDAFDALETIAGFDPADPFSRRLATGRPGTLPPGLVVGVPDANGRHFAGDRSAEAAFDGDVRRLESVGFRTQPVDMRPLRETASLLYDGPWVAERYEALRAFIKEHRDAIHPVTRSIIEAGARVSAADAFAGLHRLAALRRRAEAVWDAVDVLMVPTIPRPRTLADLRLDPIAPNAELGTYTNFVNLLDLCALAVPGEFRSDGLPSGYTLIAPAGRDAVLGALGARLHAAAGLPLGATGRRMEAPDDAPEKARRAVSDDEIELAVVGAHLSGFPLNKELVARRARYLRTVNTAPQYRFFSLPGEGPRRPGLLRVPNGGHSIEAEVWALKPDAFGAFVAGVPAPLAIGTVLLSDGSTSKGFIVESVALDGAEDISAHGGWRAFMTGASKHGA